MTAAALQITRAYAEPAWPEKYLRIPWVERGFDFAGAHCWGTVRLAFLTERAIELPRYGAISAAAVVAAARAFRRGRALPPWRCLAAIEAGEQGEDFVARVLRARLLRAFDVVTMLSLPARAGQWHEAHVGLMIDGRKLIHTDEICDTVKVELGDPLLAWRVTGIYRHEALA